ncbi:MAG: hypothetical protein EP297_13075 [Gammaproteobacteria bacterium]|nr:MAG: hypothetical protein EP297_13075 [Gammaproteobacteria bacterium]
MAKLIKFTSSIPMGMRIYTHGVEVIVPTNRYRIAKKFANRRNRRIYLQRESDNKNDSGAIKVMAKSKGWFLEARKCIGYVPADIVNTLVTTGMEDKVKARLQLIAIEDRDTINIRFDLLGPMDDYEEYSSIYFRG